MNGIYYYTDKTNGDIAYVGKDSYIDKKTRHKAHLQQSKYDEQPFNRILQNNPDRYEYGILKQGNFDQSLLTALEIIYIRRYGPRFCYTIGGEGITGYKHTPEAKKKISETGKGRTPWNKGKKGVYTEETLKQMSKSNKGKNHPQWKEYARVIKAGKTDSGTQRYALKHNGEKIQHSLDKEKLERLAKEINERRES